MINPSFISEKINIEPTSIINKGEVMRPGQTPKVENVWIYMKDVATGDSLDQSLSELVKKLKVVEREIEDIAKESEINLDIVVELEGCHTSPEINFNQEVIKFFAVIGGSLGVDIYA